MHRVRRASRVTAALAGLLIVGACSGPATASLTRARLGGRQAPASEAESAADRFERSIAAFEAADALSPPPAGGILFIGSSIFRLWSGLSEHMAPLPVFNRAFGGSRTAHVLQYMDRIVVPYRPRIIVYYCGSNDVNGGESAEAVAARYRAFSERVRVALPGTRVYFVSIIRAPQKRDRWDVVNRANALVRRYSEATPGREYIDVHPALEDAKGQPLVDLYLADRLHYQPQAYDRMADVVRPVIAGAWVEITADR
jgi:disulfide oxidoreductase YuzD